MEKIYSVKKFIPYSIYLQCPPYYFDESRLQAKKEMQKLVNEGAIESFEIDYSKLEIISKTCGEKPDTAVLLHVFKATI